MTRWIVRFSLLLMLLATFGPAGSGPAVAADAVPRHGTAEIVLSSSDLYDGATGEPNPFDLAVTAEVVSPSGKRFMVPGFFDGDGAGGQRGRVFKVRVAAEEPGSWSWKIASGVSGLAGRSGSFEVAGGLPGFFGRGPIGVSPAWPRAFQQRQGGPVFLLGKFLDVAAPRPIQFSHTMFSEQLSDDDRQAMLDRHVAMGLNKIDIYLANRGDYSGVATTPWLGTAGSSDRRYFDLRRWRLYEEWVERLRDAGLVAQLWFFADDSDFGRLPDAERQRLLRYGMARLSASVNTMFTLALEWQEGWPAPQVHGDGELLQGNNPWSRLVSVHGVTGDFSFPNALWVDYLDLQAGNDSGHPAVHALGLANRARAAKPLIQEELGLGEENAANRQKAWSAFMAGAAGVGTGADLGNLGKLAARVPFASMVPAAPLVLSGNAYALAEPKHAYVFYLYNGGTVRVNLRGAPGPLRVEWYDPRAGTFHPRPPAVGGKVKAFAAPSREDWVLYIHK
ncbi:MAG: DUF5060 domain-containing protein [Thermoanaerobaculia bacterium]